MVLLRRIEGCLYEQVPRNWTFPDEEPPSNESLTNPRYVFVSDGLDQKPAMPHKDPDETKPWLQ